MSTFKRKEPIAAGTRRLVCDHLESSIHALSRKGSTQGVRRPLMRAQALMALVAPSLPGEIARRDRKLLEEVQRALDDACFSGEAAALLQKLRPKTEKDTDDVALAKCIKATQKKLSAQSQSSLSLNTKGKRLDPMIYRLVANLAQLRGHVGNWPNSTQDDSANTLPLGLIRSYRAAQRALDSPCDQVDALAKAVAALNVLRDQLAAIGKCCPTLLKAQRSMLAQAASTAAEARFVLALIEHLSADSTAELLIDPLTCLSDKRSASAVAELNTARHLALAESPAAFNRRINAYWSHWREVAG